MKIVNARKLPVLTLGAAMVLIQANDATAQGRGGPKAKGDYNNPVCDETVIGTNLASNDLSAVETAILDFVEPVATLCLEGTFNFGDNGSVPINPQASVEELRITGIDGATIWFGEQALRFPGLAGTQSTLAKLTIDHIQFMQPSWTAISIFAGNESIQISDNIVDGVRTADTNLLGGLQIREGIIVTSILQDIAGEVVIKDNWVNAGAYADGEEVNVNVGIAVIGEFLGSLGTVTAEARVSGNSVFNFGGSGISILGVSSESVVEHNLIEPGDRATDDRIYLNRFCRANGVEIGGTSNAIVRGNTIESVPAVDSAGASPQCTASILVRADGLEENEGSDNTVRNNQIRGQGRYGIVVLGITAASNINVIVPSDRNTFVGNHLNTFEAEFASVLLNQYTNENTFKGNVGTVTDLGTDNTFTGAGAP